MIEIQSFVLKQLDKDLVVGCYSLDLSAAFDLLRPDKLLENLSEIFPYELVSPIMDFLSGHCFSVETDGIKSSLHELNVGCLQGSILGLCLFTLYMRGLASLVNSEDSCIVAYVDDTYVCVYGKTVEDIRPHLELVMTKHGDYLQSVGMHTKVNKTELIYFSQKSIIPQDLMVKGITVRPTDTMKILGVKFDRSMNWDAHQSNIKKKAFFVMRKLKFLSRFIGPPLMKRVITSHFFGMFYYASAAWMNELTSSSQWKHSIVSTTEHLELE